MSRSHDHLSSRRTNYLLNRNFFADREKKQRVNTAMRTKRSLTPMQTLSQEYNRPQPKLRRKRLKMELPELPCDIREKVNGSKRKRRKLNSEEKENRSDREYSAGSVSRSVSTSPVGPRPMDLSRDRPNFRLKNLQGRKPPRSKILDQLHKEHDRESMCISPCVSQDDRKDSAYENPNAPICRNDDYETTPSLSQMKQYSDAELARLPFFKVICGHGEIEFQEPVDVRNIVIDDIIQFEKNCCQVYNDVEENAKPDIGSELNVAAQITLFNVQSRNGSLEKFRKKLQRLTEKVFGGTFKRYDENLKHCVFCVRHF